MVRNRETTGHSGRDRLPRMRQTGRICPANEHAETISAELVEATEEIASALGIETGSAAIRRHRVTYRDGHPVSSSVSWIDGALAELAPKLLHTERLKEGTPRHIEIRSGRTIEGGRDQIAARAATTADNAALGVPEGSPVLAGRNWIYDTNGDVLEYGESVTSQDRWSSYDYAIPR